VALSADGNTALIGGPSDDGVGNGLGAAWVFTRSGATWTQQGPKLVGTGATGDAGQGLRVALSGDGNTALISGPDDNHSVGAVWVFTRSGSTWTQQGPKLVGTGATRDTEQGDGVALSADGSTALIGGRGDNGYTGAAWVFTRSGSTWTQQGKKLVGTGAIDDAQQGSSVALSGDGNTALIGGHNDNGGVGAAWVFTRSRSTWTQQGKKLVGSGATGYAAQGESVALSADGSTALIGGPIDNELSRAAPVGAAWVFTRSGPTWAQEGRKLVGTAAINPAPEGGFGQGWSVALSGDGSSALIGGPNDNGGVGAAWVWVSQPSNQFTVRHIRVHRNGTVEFDVTVPSGGQLDVLETNWTPSPPRGPHTVLLHPGPHRYALARRHLDISHAGTHHVTIRPSALGARQIRHHYRPVRINLWVTYQPTGGSPANAAFINLFVTR